MDLDVFAGWAMALLFLAAVVSAWLGVFLARRQNSGATYQNRKETQMPDLSFGEIPEAIELLKRRINDLVLSSETCRILLMSRGIHNRGVSSDSGRDR